MALQAKESLDWQQVLARLAQAQEAMDAGQVRTPEQVHRLLRRRAAALAQPLAAALAPEETLLLLVFILDGRRFGVEATHVLEALPLRNLTPVPGAPGCIAGVANLRGRMVAVVNLNELLQLPERGTASHDRLVVIQAGPMTCGLAVDEVVGMRTVPRQSLAPLLHPDLGDAGFIRGSTADRVVVLDPQALAGHPGLNGGNARPGKLLI